MPTENLKKYQVLFTMQFHLIINFDRLTPKNCHEKVQEVKDKISELDIKIQDDHFHLIIPDFLKFIIDELEIIQELKTKFFNN